MTNARQIAQVYQPLIERHSDVVASKGGWLWVTPIRHVALRVLIERTSLGDHARPQWCILSTFLLDQQLDTCIGQYGFSYVRKPIRTNDLWSKCWLWSDPTMIGDLIALIENETLPFLRSLDTLEKYAEYYRKKFDCYQIEQAENRMIVDIALGDLNAARKTCLDLLPKYRENKNTDWWLYQNLRTKVLTVAEPLLAGDRDALAAILHRWEAGNMRASAVGAQWQRTPFPLEMA